MLPTMAAALQIAAALVVEATRAVVRPTVGQVVGGVPAPPNVLAVGEKLAHRRGEGTGIGVQQPAKRGEKRLDRLVILPKHAVLEDLGGPPLAEVPAEGEPVGDGTLPLPGAGVATPAHAVEVERRAAGAEGRRDVDAVQALGRGAGCRGLGVLVGRAGIGGRCRWSRWGIEEGGLAHGVNVPVGTRRRCTGSVRGALARGTEAPLGQLQRFG